MKLFQINWDRFALLLTPISWRSRFDFAFVRSLLEAISTQLSVFNKNRDENIYNLAHNGQICYLRAMLNDKFDAGLRRIYIEDVIRYNWVFLYKEIDDKPVWADNNLPTMIPGEGYVVGINTLNFTVVVPVDLVFELAQMVSLINYYKLVSKRYAIVLS